VSIQPLVLSSDLSVLLYGDTGHGKSTLIAELATHLKVTTGKKTAVFLADKGSAKPYRALAKHGVVDVYTPTGNAWLWVNHALQGQIRTDHAKATYTSVATEDIGLIVHEGLTAYAEILMSELAQMSAQGQDVGGGGAWNVTIKDGRDVLKLGTSNRAHYGVVQLQIREGVLAEKPHLPHIYTAGVRRGESAQNTPILGPLVIGEALTSQLPRWVDYTFRCALSNGKYHLHLAPHTDQQLGPRTVVLSNPRLPKAGASVVVPASIEPANLVKALTVIQRREDAADAELVRQLANQKKEKE
jgi:energy-coupling factor transporter ATP-binding protein EcfA2